MATTISDAYWDSILSGAAYGDELPGRSLTESAAAALESDSLAAAFVANYTVLDISTTTATCSSGFAAMVAKDKTTGKVDLPPV